MFSLGIPEPVAYRRCARPARANVGHGLVAYLELRLVTPERDEFVVMLKLFPGPVEAISLEGLYLAHDLRALGHASRPFVYTNFIASLDGRIAVKSSHTGSLAIPKAIANPYDWRLFQELAAQADALITTGRYARELAAGHAQDVLPLSPKPEYQDLFAWRMERRLAPQPAVVIVSASLDFPLTGGLLEADRKILVATTARADPARLEAIAKCGIEIVIAGEAERVQGIRLMDSLHQQGFALVYSTAGPQILAMLLANRRLDRLYLTQVNRILGAQEYDTLVSGPRLIPPVDWKLTGLYYGEHCPDNPGQLFGVYDRLDGPVAKNCPSD